MQNKENPEAEKARPRTWILQSPHSGDNTQLRAIAGALGWPSEVKRLAYRKHEGLLRLFSRPTLAGVDLAASSRLEAPWPDLVICSGRGAEAVAFWLKQQNPALRIVFVGTPWSDLRRFDLVITTPQYRLPQAENVLHNLLPVHDVTPQRIAIDAARWNIKLGMLPRPFTAVLVGGSSGPYLFTPGSAARLGREASAIARAEGGSLLITTSARTGDAATQALLAAVDVPRFIYRWDKDTTDNPFHAFLGLATRIIVTADSISMMAEAASTAKPVLLFDIEEGPHAMRAEGDGAKIGWRGRNLDTTFFRLLINHAPPRYSRDLRIVHRQLVSAGVAQWLGDRAPPVVRPVPRDELSRTAARIRALFGLNSKAPSPAGPPDAS